MKHKKSFLLISAILLSFLFSSCSNTPKNDPYQIYTIAAATVQANLTETALAKPTETATQEPTFTMTPTKLSVPTMAPVNTEMIVPEPTATVAAAIFPDKADFVAVEPFPNQFLPGQKFTLSWDIKNVGTSSWSGKYRFYHKEGAQIALSSEANISAIIEPGGTLRISLPAEAPPQTGNFQTTWALKNPNGVDFYYVYYTVIVGDTTYITSVATSAPTPNITATPSTLRWLCTDPDRSLIQGDGCADFCAVNKIPLILEGLSCYSYGKKIE